MNKKRLMAAGLALTAFIIIAYSVTRGSEPAFDIAISEFFYSLRADWLNPLVIALTHLGDTKSCIAICVVLLIIPNTRIRYGIPTAAVAITASSLNHYLKTVFLRPRPDITYHIIEQGGWSFPSGHSISALVIFGMLILLVRRNVTDKKKANILTALLLIPCFGIGLSRIYVGVHFPTDVLAGWCLGIIILVIGMEVVEFIERKLHGKHKNLC